MMEFQRGSKGPVVELYQCIADVLGRVEFLRKRYSRMRFHVMGAFRENSGQGRFIKNGRKVLYNKTLRIIVVGEVIGVVIELKRKGTVACRWPKFTGGNALSLNRKMPAKET